MESGCGEDRPSSQQAAELALAGADFVEAAEGVEHRPLAEFLTDFDAFGFGLADSARAKIVFGAPRREHDGEEGEHWNPTTHADLVLPLGCQRKERSLSVPYQPE